MISPAASIRCITFCLVTAIALVAVRADDSKPSVESESIADAAEQKNWKLVGSLLSDGDRSPQADGMTALHWAVHWNEPRSVARLIEARFDVNAKTDYQVTALSIACEGGHAKIVDQLIAAGVDVNDTLPGKITPLMIASRTGNTNVVRSLLAAGGKVDAKEHKGQTALMWAAAAGNVETVDALLKAGADPNVKLRSGFTAMLFAARHGRLESCVRLLEAGVDVNDVMKPANTSGRNPRNGMSALLLATESGHFELAIELVKRGADPNDQRSRFAPLHAVTWVRKTKVGDSVDGDPAPRGSGQLTSLGFVEQIIHLGADVNLRLKNGSGGRAKMSTKGATPFLMAARTSDLPMMKLLAELGADISQTNAESCTPLMAVAGIGVTAVGEEPGSEPEVIEAMKWLVERGADTNAVDENGETAMHGVAYRNYPVAVGALADLGADPEVWNKKNRYGWTPVMIAQGNRPGSFKPSPETIRALRAEIGVKK